MSKFKVGDKVALSNSPNVLLGQVEGDVCEVFGGYYIKMEENYYAIMSEDDLVLYEETALSDDEIYTMLKPKLESMCMKTEYHKLLPTVFELEFEPQKDYAPYIPESDVIKAIALAYRSGYLRAKKGRPFKIGGEKE